MSLESFQKRACRSVLGVSVGLHAPECPWSLRGSRSVPGDLPSCLAGGASTKKTEKKCPRSVRAVRSVLGVSGAPEVSLETPGKKRARRVSGSLRLFPECPRRLRN